MRGILAFFSIFIMSTNVLYSQNEPVVAEAESGTLGADFSSITDGSVTYITPQTDYIDGSFPASTDKVASFSINFADTGTYDLYARVRVGVGSYTDDSFFTGNGFGEKSPTTGSDWLLINGIVPTGYTDSVDVVNGAGDAGTQTWKWINISEYLGGATPITFTVDSVDSTYIFQYGSRENGLDSL